MAPFCREAAAKVWTLVLAPRTDTILTAASRANLRGSGEGWARGFFGCVSPFIT